MGASAGGLDAFQRFFSKVPPTNGMAFVVVQHLDPRHPSLLPELLAKATSMSVAEVEDETPVQPDHVYVIPANGTLTINGAILRVKPVESKIPRMPIDSLFHSLAEDQGHNAVAILFSGSGTDGTLGTRAVKEHGGMVMAQTPESAQHDPMLRSAIATGLVDHVLPPEQLAAKLLEYATYAPALRANGLVTDQLNEVARLVRRQTGHDFSQYKTGTLSRRIQRRMQLLQVSSAADYIDRLRKDAIEVDRLFRDLLISVTYFFRDPEAWQALATEIIPQIVEQAAAEAVLRVWIPACATGEEAYSVAILIKEAMVQKRVKPKVQIFAGDIDEEALVVARQASYPEGIAEHVTPDRLERFFIREDHRYRVVKEIREMVIFAAHDLIKDPPFSRQDLIICRNLLIYLEAEPQQFVANLFHYALRPGGYLFLGPSESLAGPPELFRTIDRKHRIYQRSEVLARQFDVVPGLAGAGPRRAIATGTVDRGGKASAQTEPMSLLERVLLDQFTPAWVVINAAGECLYFSNRTGRYLEPAAGAPSAAIVDMARPSLRLDLRAAIHKVVKTGQAVTHENVMVETNGEVQRIDLTVRPLRELGEGTQLFIVVFKERGSPKTRAEAAAEGAVPRSGDAIVQQLESELRDAREQLQASSEELEAANEELKSSNEELLSTNEELQSSNEELQTSKEELQSVNEELETINSELNKKVQELDRVNADLENLFHGSRIPTLFLDTNLRIKRFTGAATEVFRLIGSDVGRPLADITARFPNELVNDMKEVSRTLVTKEREIRVADDGSSYVMRIFPYRRMDNLVEGLVVTFQNITQLAQTQEQRNRLAAIVDSAHDAIVGSTPDGTITSWNEAATQLFGYSESEAVGSPLSSIVPSDCMAELKETEARLLREERVVPFESIRQTKDGRRVPVLVTITPILDTDGRIVGSAGVYRDLRDVRRAESRFRAAVESSPNGMLMVNADGRIVLVNREVERLFGYTRDELVGEPVEKLVPARLRRGHPALRAGFGAHPEKRSMGAGRELFGLRKDGSEVPVDIGLTPVATEEGLFVIAAIVDVSLRKHAEALREESRRKDQFLAVLSHELRGPLASLRICVNLIESKVTAGGRFREAIEIADRQLEHLASLVDQLLDASRIATGKFVLDRKVRNLVDIVRTAAEDQRPMLESQDVQFTVQVPAQPLWINGDGLRLSQIVVNLLGNSAKFSPKGGRATLTLAPDEGGQVAVLSVKDDGAGIEPDVLPIVFQPFTRADPGDVGERGGLGLGLALVQSLVHAHGGSVEARSEGRGRGAELIIRLPLVRPPAPDAAATPAQPASRPAATRRRILVVEDNHDTARSLGWSLETLGHEVMAVQDGATALQTMRTFHPQVVLCDIGLPGGMDGYAVAEAIRADHASGDPYLIAVTGYGMPADKARAEEAGFDQFFVKGRDPRVLFDLIDRMPRR